MTEYGQYQKQWLDTFGTIDLEQWRFVHLRLPRAEWPRDTTRSGTEGELNLLRDGIFNGDITAEDIRESQPAVYRKYRSTLQQLEAITARQNTKADWVFVGDWTPDNIEPYPSKKDGGYAERQANLERNVYHYWPQQPNNSAMQKPDKG
jgi:hypothetical protein